MRSINRFPRNDVVTGRCALLPVLAPQDDYLIALNLFRDPVSGERNTNYGLHEPVSCTKTCTNEVRLAYGAVSVASRPAS